MYIFGSHQDAWMVPLVARSVLTGNKSGLSRYNLKGIGLGNAWFDPIQQYSSMEHYMIKHNLISMPHFVFNIKPNIQTCIDLVHFCSKKTEAERSWYEFLFGNDCTAATQGCNGLFLANVTGTNVNYWDIRKKCINYPIC